MPEIKQIEKKTKTRAGWGRRIWGMLPLLLLAGLIFIVVSMLGKIREENRRIKTEQRAAIKKEEPRTNVVALTLIPDAVQDKVNFPGVVTPFKEVRVLTEIRGKVTKKYASEGAFVKTGAKLAALDTRDYRHQLTSSKASYQAALSNKQRIEQLYREQLATRAQYDEAVARVDTLKAAMDSAGLIVDRGMIRAPMKGELNTFSVEVGQYLNVGDPVAHIIQTDRVIVEVGIPESDVDAVRAVEAFQIAIDALNGKMFAGTRHLLSKTADPNARLYRLEILVENPDGIILPDMFTRVEIVKQNRPDALVIPLYAVITKNDRQYAYVVNDERAHVREVQLGIQEGWQVEVTDGLIPGERVIVVGHRSVSDESAVRVVREVSHIGEINP